MPRSLRHGRQLVAIPGPSVIPDRVLAAMHQPMPNIYEGDLIDTSKSVIADLPGNGRQNYGGPGQTPGAVVSRWSGPLRDRARRTVLALR